MSAAVLSISGEPIAFRPMQQGDQSYVLATWLRSFRDLVPRRLVPDDVFFAHVRPIVEEATRNGWIVVACSESMPTTIYGWGCKYNGVVLYTYVMGALRGHGLGRAIDRALRE